MTTRDDELPSAVMPGGSSGFEDDKTQKVEAKEYSAVTEPSAPTPSVAPDKACVKYNVEESLHTSHSEDEAQRASHQHLSSTPMAQAASGAPSLPNESETKAAVRASSFITPRPDSPRW